MDKLGKPCDDFQLDMHSNQFGMCKCGFPRHDHVLKRGPLRRKRKTGVKLKKKKTISGKDARSKATRAKKKDMQKASSSKASAVAARKASVEHAMEDLKKLRAKAIEIASKSGSAAEGDENAVRVEDREFEKEIVKGDASVSSKSGRRSITISKALNTFFRKVNIPIGASTGLASNFTSTDSSATRPTLSRKSSSPTVLKAVRRSNVRRMSSDTISTTNAMKGVAGNRTSVETTTSRARAFSPWTFEAFDAISPLLDIVPSSSSLQQTKRNIALAAKRSRDRRVRCVSVDEMRDHTTVILRRSLGSSSKHDSDDDDDDDNDGRARNFEGTTLPISLVPRASVGRSSSPERTRVVPHPPSRPPLLEKLEDPIERVKRRLTKRTSSALSRGTLTPRSRHDTAETASTTRSTSGSFDSPSLLRVDSAGSVSTTSSSRRNVRGDNARRRVLKNIVLKRGRVKKQKRTRQWKDVDLVLKRRSLTYSYSKNFLRFKKVDKKKKLMLDRIERVSVVRISDMFGSGKQKDGKAFEVFIRCEDEDEAPAAWRFKTESDHVAAAWVKELRNAIRDGNSALGGGGGVSAERIGSSSCRAGYGGSFAPSPGITSPEDLFFSILDATTLYVRRNLDVSFTLGGIVDKMSDHRRRWNPRYIVYQPNAKVLRYRRPQDPEDVWRDEHWCIGKWSGCGVIPVTGEPLGITLEGATTYDGEVASDLTLRFKTQHQFELILHILREAGVNIDFNFLKYLRYRPSDLERSLSALQETELDWREHSENPEYVTLSHDDAFTITKYLDYLKITPLYQRSTGGRGNPTDATSSRRSFRMSMSLRNNRRSVADPKRASMSSFKGFIFGSKRRVGSSDSPSSLASSLTPPSFSSRDNDSPRSRPTSRFFDSLRLASLFKPKKGESGVTAVEEMQASKPKVKVDESNLIDMLTPPAGDGNNLAVPDLLDSIGPPPTPSIDENENSSEDFEATPTPTPPANMGDDVDLGYFYLRPISKLDLKRKSVDSDDGDREEMQRRRYRAVLEGNVMRAKCISSADESVIELGPRTLALVTRGAVVEVTDVWESEVTIMSVAPSRSSRARAAKGANVLVVDGVNVRCRHGIEHLRRVLLSLQRHGASMSARCELFLSEMDKLTSDEGYMKEAKRKLAIHIAKLPWGLVKNVLPRTDLVHQKRKIKQEFGSREFLMQYYKHAQMSARGLVRLPSDFLEEEEEEEEEVDDTSLANGGKSKTAPRPPPLSRVKSPPLAIKSMVSSWATEFATMSKHKQERMTNNVFKSLSQSDVMHSPTKSPGATERSLLQRKSISDNLTVSPGVAMGHIPFWDSVDRYRLVRKIAIFVLGPSASGKTHMTRENLRLVLRSNGLNLDSLFVSIDGGIMRDCSRNWNCMKHRHTRDFKGFKDLFSGYFQPYIRRLKKQTFHALLRRGVNMIIPETSVNASSTVEHYHGPASKGKVKIMFDKLKSEGYTILMTAVHASRQKCMSNGKHREVLEGKKYKNASWGIAIGSISRMFNYYREEGYLEQTQFVMDNSDWSDPETLVVPPYHGLRLLATLNENEDDEEEIERGTSDKGRWDVFVLPRSGPLWILSATAQKEGEGGSSNSLVDDGTATESVGTPLLYYFWKEESFELKDQWLRSRTSDRQWDLSGAAIATYTNGVRKAIKECSGSSPKSNDERNAGKESGGVSPYVAVKTSKGIRSAALATRPLVIEIEFPELPGTHFRAESLLVSPPDQSNAANRWIGHFVAAARWGRNLLRDGKAPGSL
eukprot:g3569.t1